MQKNQLRTKLAIALMATAALGSFLVLVVRTRQAPRPGPPPASPVAPAAVSQKPDPDPEFPTPAQAARHYGAVVKGERRALALVEEALRKARAAGADADQVRKLESLRASYQERLKRHQARVNL